MADTTHEYTLLTQGQTLWLAEGVALDRTQFPLLSSSDPGGPVARVNANPNDPAQLGLQNLTASPWEAVMPDGTQRTVPPGKTVRLTPGTVITVGGLRWEIGAAPIKAAQVASGPGWAPVSVPAPARNAVNQAQVNAQTPPRPGGAARNANVLGASSSLSFSQLFPVAGERKALMGKGYLVPGIVTVLFGVMMLLCSGNFGAYNTLLALYIGLGALFVVYRLCGKSKPWWALALPAVFTAIFIVTPFWTVIFFLTSHLLPGTATPGEFFPFALIHEFFGPGLREEFVKAIPVFLMLAWGRKAASPRRERVGVWEPLDGILLACASALGFTLIETLGQYVPGQVHDIAQKLGEGAGQAMGLELLIPRILGTISGHMAYSGYFGYFIGLSVLKPKHRWKILGIGYLSAAGLHALWDATCNSAPGLLAPLLLCFFGVVSYAFLMAAILKARQVSPDRAQNFATQIQGVP
ncbi:MAG: PrsW family glutamic-type intramembrane protease [Armatimonadota bacterium]|nr:PrsW family glutamic-type intramembrane protease [Armatimonadota bacterium]